MTKDQDEKSTSSPSDSFEDSDDNGSRASSDESPGSTHGESPGKPRAPQEEGSAPKPRKATSAALEGLKALAAIKEAQVESQKVGLFPWSTSMDEEESASDRDTTGPVKQMPADSWSAESKRGQDLDEEENPQAAAAKQEQAPPTADAPAQGPTAEQGQALPTADVPAQEPTAEEEQAPPTADAPAQEPAAEEDQAPPAADAEAQEPTLSRVGAEKSSLQTVPDAVEIEELEESFDSMSPWDRVKSVSKDEESSHESQTVASKIRNPFERRPALEDPQSDAPEKNPWEARARFLESEANQASVASPGREVESLAAPDTSPWQAEGEEPESETPQPPVSESAVDAAPSDKSDEINREARIPPHDELAAETAASSPELSESEVRHTRQKREQILAKLRGRRKRSKPQQTGRSSVEKQSAELIEEEDESLPEAAFTVHRQSQDVPPLPGVWPPVSAQAHEKEPALRQETELLEAMDDETEPTIHDQIGVNQDPVRAIDSSYTWVSTAIPSQKEQYPVNPIGAEPGAPDVEAASAAATESPVASEPPAGDDVTDPGANDESAAWSEPPEWREVTTDGIETAEQSTKREWRPSIGEEGSKWKPSLPKGPPAESNAPARTDTAAEMLKPASADQQRNTTEHLKAIIDVGKKPSTSKSKEEDPLTLIQSDAPTVMPIETDQAWSEQPQGQPVVPEIQLTVEVDGDQQQPRSSMPEDSPVADSAVGFADHLPVPPPPPPDEPRGMEEADLQEFEKLLSEANEHFAMGRFTNARPLYMTALQMLSMAGASPEQEKTLKENLADIFVFLDKPEEAVMYFEQARQVEGASPVEINKVLSAILKLASMYENVGSMDEAEQHYARALELSEELQSEDPLRERVGEAYSTFNQRRQGPAIRSRSSRRQLRKTAEITDSAQEEAESRKTWIVYIVLLLIILACAGGYVFISR